VVDSDEPCAVLPRRGGHRYVQAERARWCTACPLLITYVTVSHTPDLFATSLGYLELTAKIRGGRKVGLFPPPSLD
jgi:hypothetical protein